MKTVLRSPREPTTVVLTNGPRNALYALARSVQTHGACSYVTYRMEPIRRTMDTHSMAVTRAEARLSRVYRRAKNRLARASTDEARYWCDRVCFTSPSSLQKSPITAQTSRSSMKKPTSPAASGRDWSMDEYICCLGALGNCIYSMGMHVNGGPAITWLLPQHVRYLFTHQDSDTIVSIKDDYTKRPGECRLHLGGWGARGTVLCETGAGNFVCTLWRGVQERR